MTGIESVKKVKDFLEDERGVIIRKKDWVKCKKFLNERLSDQDKIALRDLDIAELEVGFRNS